MAEVVLEADFLVRFPMFSGVPAAQLAAQLEDANATFSETAFINTMSYRRAVMLLAAHNLVSSGAGATQDAQLVAQGFAIDSIQSVSDSGVSVSMRDSSGTTRSMYSTTSFGRELGKLLRAVVASGVVGGARHSLTPTTTSHPVDPSYPGNLKISDDPQNIIEHREDGLFAAPKLTSSRW